MRLRLALCASLILGCGGKPSVSVPKGPTLGVAPPASHAPKDGPLTVAYFAPVGETHGGQLELSASFDRPMVELGQDTPPDGALTIEPEIEGRTRWVGSQTLMFEPSAPLPMGSEFRVRIAGLSALDGKRMGQPLEFTFATPALALADHSVEQEPSQRRKTPFELRFNAPVDPAALAQATTLQLRNGRAVPFTVEADAADPKRLRVLPKTAYPIGAKVELTVRSGLRGMEGPRPLARDEVVRLEVYGALRVLPSPPCEDEQCVPMLRFSNPVHTKDAYARLVFDPPVAPSVRNDDYVTDQLYFGEELAPGSTYTVRVEGPLKDVYGTHLTNERSAVVRTPPFPPLAQLLITGDQRPGGTGPVRAQLQNLQSAQLELYPLPLDEVLPGALDAIAPKAPAIRKAFGAVGPVERKVIELDAREALPQGKGLVLAVLQGQAKRERFEQRKLLAFGDLAPSLKVGRRDGVVWVTELAGAKPVAGARVRVVLGSRTLAQGVSDARGVFAFQFTPPTDEDGDRGDVAAVVEKDGQLGFTQKYSGIGPWELSGRGSDEDEGGTRAHLFTERGIYRPGDTVQLKGILRDADAGGLSPSRGEVTLRVVDASDVEVETTTLPLSAYGSFARAIRVPGSVQLGPLSMTVRHHDQSFHESVEIAEFRPAELEAKLVPSRERALANESVQAKLAASYLFGTPAAGAHVYWSAHYQPRHFTATGYEGFTFQDRDVDEDGYAIAGSGEGELDARGELTITTKLDQVPRYGPSRLEIESSINVDSAQLSARAYVEVLPSSVVVGVKPGSTLIEHDKPFEAELVALDPDGKPRAGVALTATLLHRTWSDDQGRWTPHDTRVAGCKQKSGTRAVRCALETHEPGLYVVRAEGKDAAGRVSRAEEYVYVWGDGSAGWGEQDERVISLHAERDRYKLGETAKILVPSPFPHAEALVTVEREGVLSSERVQLGSASTIEVAIDQRFVPNAFVSVLLLRPLADGPEGPAFRVGTVELSADVSDRRLKVDVQPDADEKRPGEEVAVTLAVKDASDKPVQSELTVFAVDEGVLTLTGYGTPDPFAAIYAPHGLSVWTSDVRGSLQRLLDAADEDKGGDEGGGGGAEVMRRNVSAVALYVPSLTTDAAGRAALRFKLPDSTTKFRVMAVAAARDSKLGSGESAVRTKKPLMMRPLLPRVMRAGDALSGGVVVHNETGSPLRTSVHLDAKGLTLAQPGEQQITVPAHGATQVRYALRAERVGKVALRFRAKAAHEEDALAFEREVLSPSVLETMRISGSTSQAVQEALAPLADVRTDVGGLKIALAASALVDLEAPARQLFAYRFGCTEQLASRLIALAALERLRKPLALDDAPFADSAAQLVSELEKHQNADGSFGLWRADDRSTPWLQRFLTAYALITFEQLERAGIASSPHARERARSFLVRGLRDELPFEDRAFLVYALARTGTLELGYAHKLFEQRAQLSLLGRIELAHALTRLNAKPEAQSVLDELSSHVRVAPDRAHLESASWAGAFESDVRATGELLELLLEHAPEHALVPKLARWLSAARGRDGGYVNTQEAAWAVMSLADYLTRRESVAPALRASVELDAQSLGTFALSGHRASGKVALPMEKLPRSGAPLLLRSEGRGTLHYGLQLEYAPQELPRVPVERGFFVERSYERLDPLALARGDVQGEPSERAKLHDYVRVTLRIAVPSAREFVMIEDALPAGLEPVDSALASEFGAAARALPSAHAPEDHRELREQGARIAINDLPPGLYRYSYLARATTPGSFVAPPARVEEMYHPDTQGLTAATRFTVDAP